MAVFRPITHVLLVFVGVGVQQTSKLDFYIGLLSWSYSLSSLLLHIWYTQLSKLSKQNKNIIYQINVSIKYETLGFWGMFIS